MIFFGVAGAWCVSVSPAMHFITYSNGPFVSHYIDVCAREISGPNTPIPILLLPNEFTVFLFSIISKWLAHCEKWL